MRPYEMLTGARAFKGEDVSDTLAFILTQQPDWDALPATTPAAIRRLLRRCLEKDRKRRLADAADARLEIDEACTSPADHSIVSGPPIRPSVSRHALPVAVAAIVASAITGIVVGRGVRPSSTSETPIRFTIPLPEQQRLGTGRPILAISPDGTKVVIAENEQLYLRSLSESETRPIPGSQIAEPR